MRAAIGLWAVPLQAVLGLLVAGAALAAIGVVLLVRASVTTPSPRGRRIQRHADRAETPGAVAHRAFTSTERRVPQRALQEPRRHDDAALGRLAEGLAIHRCRALARARLGEELAKLRPAAWHVERDIVCRGVTVPFVVFGPNGVFALTGAAAWRFCDLGWLDWITKELSPLVPD
jgi:hypothetical protein